MRVALIGFGVMGSLAAQKLTEAGHVVVVTDPSSGAREKAQEQGFGISQTPDLDAEVAILFLPGPSVIRQVVPGLLSGNLKTIVDHSTADPSSARDMAKLAAAENVGWVDAPVLGRPVSVGNWALPCGATDGALDHVKPLFDQYARAVYDMGGPGNGHMVKLLNQMMFGAINAMTAEMMAISDQLGLPPARLFEIITASQAGTVSNLFKELGGRITEDDLTAPTFSVKLLEKDVRLGLEMAREGGMEPQLGAVVGAMNTSAVEKGFGDEDTAGMWRSILAD